MTEIPVVFTDGGCSGNPGPMGIGVVVTLNGEVTDKIKKRPEGTGTNNVAEYMAIIEALEYCIAKKIPEIILKSDSQLCVGQISQGWKINQDHLKKLFEKVKELEKKIKVKFEHILRAENLADELSNMAL